MQKFIAKYALAAHLAVIAVAPLFLYPDWVAWLSLVGLIWILKEPSKINGESLYSARRRVLEAVVRDPFFWVTLTLLAYFIVIRMNSGVALAYDAENAEWFMSSASMPILPASATGFGAVEVSGFLALTIVGQGCRHALGRSARLAFLTAVSFLAGIASLVMIACLALGYDTVFSMVKCDISRPEYIGCAFGIYSLGASAALVGIFKKRWFKNLFFVWVGIVGTAAGLFLFAPPSVAALFVAGHVVLFLYSFFYAIKEMGAMVEFKYMVVFLIALTVATVAVFFVLPEDVMAEKTSPWVTGAFLSPEMLDVRKNLSDIAFSAWHKAPWLGTGLGTFALDIKFNATADALMLIPEVQAMPLNGYWKLLAENGIIGAGLYALMYGFLLYTFIRRLASGARVEMPQPLCLAGIAAFAVVALESLLDCSFLVPGTMVALCSLMALSASSFPKGVK